MLSFYVCFAYVHACASHEFLVHAEAGRGCQIPWLWASTWVLDIKPLSSDRATSVPNAESSLQLVFSDIFDP